MQQTSLCPPCGLSHCILHNHCTLMMNHKYLFVCLYLLLHCRCFEDRVWLQTNISKDRLKCPFERKNEESLLWGETSNLYIVVRNWFICTWFRVGIVRQWNKICVHRKIMVRLEKVLMSDKGCWIQRRLYRIKKIAIRIEFCKELCWEEKQDKVILGNKNERKIQRRAEYIGPAQPEPFLNIFQMHIMYKTMSFRVHKREV